MKNYLALSVAIIILASLSCAKPEVRTEVVRYMAEGKSFVGLLAYDTRIKGRRPGVLVVHEWWGLNEYAKKRAAMLAELGYTALALDMYGDGKQANHPADAMKFSGELMKNFPEAKARFDAALDLLKKQDTVDPDKIAGIGYCFGGGMLLNAVRQGADLDGAVTFHAGLAAVKPAEKGMVRAKLLVCNGADDPFVTAEQIEAFKKEMEAAGADLTFNNYPGALHSFTNPDADRSGREFKLPLKYNEEADRASWDAMKKFLGSVFH